MDSSHLRSLRATAVVVATAALLVPPSASAAGQVLGPAAERAWTFEHASYRVSVPRGWHVAEFDAATRSHRRVASGGPGRATAGQVSFADGKGNYFTVCVDQPLDFETDAAWTLRGRSSGGVEVVSEGNRCRLPSGASRPEAGDDCPAGDGWLAIGTYAVQLRGHGYAFFFGNTAREDGVPLTVFRQILRSFRAR